MVDRVAASWESQFRLAAVTALAHDQAAINRLIEAARQETRKAATPPPGPPPIQWFNFLSLMGDVGAYLSRQSQATWRQTFVPIMQGVISAQADNWAAVLGVQFDVRNLYAERWFESYILEFAQAVSQTTSDGISELLQQSMREGWGFGQTTQRLQQVFRQWQAGGATPDDFAWLEARMPTYRAMTIARTESMRASNAGALRLFEEWGADAKEWSAHLDHRVRDSHRAAHGQVQPAGQPFIVGGARLMFPGDSSLGAPPSQYILCRCVVIPVIHDTPPPPAQTPPALQAPPTPDEMAQKALEDVLAVDQRMRDEQERLNQAINALRRRYEAAAADWANARGTETEDEALLARRAADDELQRASDAFWDFRRDYEKNRRAAMQAALVAPGGPGVMAPEVYSESTRRRARVSAGQKEAIADVIDFLTAIIGKGTGMDNVRGQFIVWNHTKNRAYHSQGDIYVRSTEAARTIAHEIGHVIEFHDRAILADNIAWRERRTAGETARTMRSLTGIPGYALSEVSKPDQFIHPYIGKPYQYDSGARRGQDYASEVLSMGLEYLYHDAADLARRDPDMFRQIIRVLRQYGGKP